MAPHRSQETRSPSGLMRTFNRFKATTSHIKKKKILPTLPTFYYKLLSQMFNFKFRHNKYYTEEMYSI